MRTVEGMIRVLTPFCVIQLFSHEIADHRTYVGFHRQSQQCKSSK